jgi:carboxylate-amine ligase
VNRRATGAAQRFTVGVEEEFFLVDPVHGGQVPRNRQVVAAARQLGVHLDLELSAGQVETNSDVCHDLTQLRRDVLEKRALAAAAALAAGASLQAVGVPVSGRPLQVVTDTPRYREMVARYGSMVTDQEISGCHVHVGVNDRETAVAVSNHLRPWLPALLALTANSAIHYGRDTGFASWRSVLFGRWPCSGPPPYFASVEDYDAEVAMLMDSGTVLDAGMVYWDVRPSAHLPTIEVRVSDVPASVDETILLAGLVRALVAAGTRAARAGDPGPLVRHELLRMACFRAARDGLTGQALDVRSGRLTTPAEQLSALLRHVRPELEELGDLARINKLLKRLLAHGNGAMRQREALAGGAGVEDLVALVARQTLQDSQPSVRTLSAVDSS